MNISKKTYSVHEYNRVTLWMAKDDPTCTAPKNKRQPINGSFIGTLLSVTHITNASSVEHDIIV